jgi:hypothetical protein
MCQLAKENSKVDEKGSNAKDCSFSAHIEKTVAAVTKLIGPIGQTLRSRLESVGHRLKGGPVVGHVILLYLYDRLGPYEIPEIILFSFFLF